ncbi:MAG: beta strand repeat-containing protein [Gemmataceae bacterium]
MSVKSSARFRHRFCPVLETYETRIAPANATFSSGVLGITFTATDNTPESVTITNNGGIALTGDISGAVNVFGVNRIVVHDSGPGDNQSLTFAGSSSFVLSGGLSIVSVEHVTVTDSIHVTGSSSLSISTPRSIILAATLSTASGFLDLSANQQAAKSHGNFTGVTIDGATVSTASGSLRIFSVGGDSGLDCNGIKLINNAKVIGGAASSQQFLFLYGVGGASPDGSACGVYVGQSSTVTSTGGEVIVTGEGAYSGGAGNNDGIVVTNASTITAGGPGSVSVHGNAGGPGVVPSYGVELLNSTIASSGGAISVSGYGGHTGNVGLVLGANSSITGPTSNSITLDADTIAIDPTNTNINVGVGTVTFVPLNDSEAIDLGLASASHDALLLTDADFSHITAGTLQIGTNLCQLISVNGDISRGGSAIKLFSTGSITLAAGLNAVSGAIVLDAGGSISQTAGTIQTSGVLTVQAGQTATFDASNNKAGTLVVPVGVTAIVNGSFDPAGLVQIDGALRGSGSVGTLTVTNTGRISPGTGLGIFGSGNLALNSNSAVEIELSGASAGASYDQLTVKGTVQLGGASLFVSLGVAPTANQVLKIIDNDGTDAISGTFNGLSEGALINIDGVNFAISYNGGNGNDVTLTAPQVVPALSSPTVLSATLGDGTNQRSAVKQVVVEFSEPVTFSGAVANAFKLSRSASSISAGQVGDVALVAYPAFGPTKSVTITFSGNLTDPGNSLKDSVYNFTIDAAQVAGGRLDGGSGSGSNYVVVGSTANRWYRLFGDGNGDATVDQNDYISQAVSGGASYFDFDNSGDVDQVDYLEFRNRIAGVP